MREICEHGNETSNCQICRAILIINQLLNVMPVLPDSVKKSVYGIEAKYNQAIREAKRFVEDN